MASHTSAESRERISSSQRGRKFMNVTVHFLDDSIHVFQLQAKNTGQVLFEKVCKFLNLLEVDYFGLEFEDEKSTKCWLDAIKPLCSQISTSFPTMHFCVKFYTPDPVQLEDEFTRYLFALQIKSDLANGFLQCNDNAAAVMISYIVQADFGDYCPEKCPDGSYLSGYKFVPLQDQELEHKIIENHKKIIGQTPAEADLNLLETARRCELYGIKMTPAKDNEGVPLNLAVAHMGVLVFQNYTKINTFSWVKIRKLSFKRKKFLIKLHPEGYGYYKDIAEYFFEGRNECKNFWKKCIENHTFFRCTDAKQGMRQKPKIFSRGSSFRYSGRTQKQVSEFVRENCFKRPPFQRSTSLKSPSSPSRSIGSSISPQPLLPIASLSCGSISDVSKEGSVPQKARSEPTTPHAAPPNLNGTKDNSGGASPELEDSREDLCTDDNVSHDSYHVLEKETTNPCLPTTTTNPPAADNTVVEEPPPLTNGTMEGSALNGKPKCFKGSLKDFTVESNNNLSERVEVEINHMGDSNANSEEALPNVTASSNMENLSTIEQHHMRNNSLSQLSTDTNFEDPPKSTDRNSMGEALNNMLNDAQQTFGTSTFYVSSPYAVKLANKKKSLSDKSYCLAKELLMTERTYRKDLEIVDVHFRDEFFKQSELDSAAAEQMLSLVDPLYEAHCSLLRDLEQRLAFWEGRPANRSSGGIKGVGDILLLHKETISVHSVYLSRLPEVLELMYEDLSNNQGFSQMYHQFEAQKMCYLPLTSFLLRPVIRLLYYSALLKDLLSYYNTQHVDYDNCLNMLNELRSPCEKIESKIPPVVNYVKLMELQRCLIGFPNLVQKNREFIREGCLLKFTKNGSHQNIFFLFSDLLLCTERTGDRFRVAGQLPCTGLRASDASPRHGMGECLLLSNGRRSLVAAAPSPRERARWVKDLRKITVGSDEELETMGEESEEEEEVETVDSAPQGSHTNTSVHVCWHRNISISCDDLLLAMKHSLSGYVLRKYKNSSGWQKVWVVLANLCLFFYRSYLDESPLASLPLPGYRIMTTSSSDLVHGDCIFKLVFKSHEYYFTVENKHTFERWMEAISISTLMEEENTRL